MLENVSSVFSAYFIMLLVYFQCDIGTDSCGELYKVRIGHSDEYVGSGWFLQSVSWSEVFFELHVRPRGNNQHRISHCGDKTVIRSSYLHNGVSYTGNITSLYWIRAQIMPDKLVIIIVTDALAPCMAKSSAIMALMGRLLFPTTPGAIS